MNDYYVRALPADWPLLISLGVKLGALVQHEQPAPAPVFDEDGEPIESTEPVPDPILTAGPGGAWDFIGEMQKPTGEVVETDVGPQPVMQTVTDENGVAYWHANLRTPVDLGAVARKKAETELDIAAALQQLDRFFLLDDNGSPRAPRQPARVWF